MKANALRRRRQRGQSLVEFAISSIVLLLLMMGLLDLSRAFYFAVNLDGAAREGARHGAWFSTNLRANNFLDDGDILIAVQQSLGGAGLAPTPMPQGGCLAGQLLSPPTDNSWRLGDINVSLLMNFQLITPLIQSLFGNGINLAYNEHFTIQGKP